MPKMSFLKMFKKMNYSNFRETVISEISQQTSPDFFALFLK